MRRYTIKTKRRDNPEGRTQLAILQMLRTLGYACGKTKTMGVRVGNLYRFDLYTFRGFPDLTAFMPEVVFIEVKSKKGRLSKDQKVFQELCEKAKTPYIVARSTDDVKEYLMKRGKLWKL